MAKEVRGVNDKDSAEQEGNSSFSISNNGFLIDHLGITGFSVVCAWHFLIIFSAGPTINAGDATGRDLIYQLTLYFSLGISYVVLQLLSKPIFSFLSKDNNRGWNRASLAFGGRLCFNGIHDFHKQRRFLPNCNCFLGCSGFIRSFSYAAMAAAAKG